MKYYQPELEEFHVGFEYEFKHSDYPECDWIKYNSPEFNWELEDCPFGKSDLSEYRVKYLDEQDIKDLGWKEIGSSKSPFTKMIYTTFEILKEVGFNTGTGYHLVKMENHKVKISMFEYSSYGATSEGITLFCKNKSELKRLMKQLGI